MHWKLQHLQPSLVNRNGPILLHTNTWPHITQPTGQKLNKLGYKALLHPPYSPDFSPANYHFFKHLITFYRQHIKKQRHYFAKKGPSGQSNGFSSSHVWMWIGPYRRLSTEEVMLSNCGSGEDSWIARRSHQSILKEINPNHTSQS